MFWDIFKKLILKDSKVHSMNTREIFASTYIIIYVRIVMPKLGHQDLILKCDCTLVCCMFD